MHVPANPGGWEQGQLDVDRSERCAERPGVKPASRPHVVCLLLLGQCTIRLSLHEFAEFDKKLFKIKIDLCHRSSVDSVGDFR